MRPRLFSHALSGAAAALLAAPAAGYAREGGFVEICTSRGTERVPLPSAPEFPAKGGGADQVGCAHALCPRSLGPGRRRGARIA